MAKLHAYHQDVVVTISKEADLPGMVPSPDGRTYEHPIWERTMYAMVDNGKLLRKRTVRWADGHRHDGGWKVAVPASRSIHAVAHRSRIDGIRIDPDAAARWIVNREAEGWSIVPGDVYFIVREAVDRERTARREAAANIVNGCR